LVKVLVLHGLGRTSVSMRFLYLRLKTARFDADLMDYPSRAATISELTDMLFEQLPEEGKLNFVGHSLGGILAKNLMKRLPPERRGRIVQLGAPNFGSEMADKAEILGPLMGPVLSETMMLSGEVIAATIEFLLTGKFDEKWQD